LSVPVLYTLFFATWLRTSPSPEDKLQKRGKPGNGVETKEKRIRIP